jgi:hypothetical protein
MAPARGLHIISNFYTTSLDTTGTLSDLLLLEDALGMSGSRKPSGCKALTFERKHSS